MAKEITYQQRERLKEVACREVVSHINEYYLPAKVEDMEMLAEEHSYPCRIRDGRMHVNNHDVLRWNLYLDDKGLVRKIMLG